MLNIKTQETLKNFQISHYLDILWASRDIIKLTHCNRPVMFFKGGLGEGYQSHQQDCAMSEKLLRRGWWVAAALSIFDNIAIICLNFAIKLISMLSGHGSPFNEQKLYFVAPLKRLSKVVLSIEKWGFVTNSFYRFTQYKRTKSLVFLLGATRSHVASQAK